MNLNLVAQLLQLHNISPDCTTYSHLFTTQSNLSSERGGGGSGVGVGGGGVGGGGGGLLYYKSCLYMYIRIPAHGLDIRCVN